MSRDNYLKYYYFQQIDGGIKQSSIVGNVIVYQDTKNDGYLIKREFYMTTNSEYRGRTKGWVWWFDRYSSWDVTEVHIPPDSISYNFCLDIKK